MDALIQFKMNRTFTFCGDASFQRSIVELIEGHPAEFEVLIGRFIDPSDFRAFVRSVPTYKIGIVICSWCPPTGYDCDDLEEAQRLFGQPVFEPH